MDSVASLAAAIPGLSVCNAGLLLDCDLASALVSAGLHLCVLKDWIAALAIYQGGGSTTKITQAEIRRLRADSAP